MLRIRKFLGLLDPDADPSIIKQNKNMKKNLDSYCFVIFYLLKYVNVHSKSNKQKKCFFFKLVFCWSMTKTAGSGSESGSNSQRHGSADPDSHQNVMDPQHWLQETTWWAVKHGSNQCQWQAEPLAVLMIPSIWGCKHVGLILQEKFLFPPSCGKLEQHTFQPKTSRSSESI